MVETIAVTRVKRFSRNPLGRDIAVGDIHGHFTRLQAALEAAGFDPAVDRLFSVGDLVDRGPENEDAIAWLSQPWFHAVRGNHDDYVVRFDTCNINQWIFYGGSWFFDMPHKQQRNHQTLFTDMPIAIEVETTEGVVGIVHADCVFRTWADMKGELETPESDERLRLVEKACMWSRTRFQEQNKRTIPDVRAVVVGHTPISSPLILGNVHHIDTGGWLQDGSGYFTLLDLETLLPIGPENGF